MGRKKRQGFLERPHCKDGGGATRSSPYCESDPPNRSRARRDVERSHYSHTIEDDYMVLLDVAQQKRQGDGGVGIGILGIHNLGGTSGVCIWHIPVSKGYFLPSYNLLGILDLK